MDEAHVRTDTGGTATLTATDLKTLQGRLAGSLLSPGSTAYEEARTIWNAMIDRHPALIVRCLTADDVVHAVQLAERHRLVLAVRAGGHNIAGNAVCDGGLMIDLSHMNKVTVDPPKKTARVEAGATLGDIDKATQAHGLAVPIGINSTTGIAGLTLGGGFGWLSRSLGLSIDNLQAAQVVTAAGMQLTVSASEHTDLFWAIRGGGGNFGVVTSFDFGLHPVGPEVLSGLIVYPLAAAHDVLRFYRTFVAQAPDEFACWFVMRQAPPLPFLAPEWHGKEILALAMCYNGPIADGERIARPLRAFGRPLADVVAPHPFTAWQQILDPLLAPGARNYWKSHDFRELSDGLIDALIDAAHHIPDPQTEIAFAQLGGAINRVPNDATAYGHRDAQFVMNVHGRWADPAKDSACIGWARGLFDAAAPFSTGAVYVNFLTQDEQGRVKAAYGANYERLALLKKKYDPTNLFRMNQNIRPADSVSGHAERV
jgi:FAD/FMN-containing dehydrogenase